MLLLADARCKMPKPPLTESIAVGWRIIPSSLVCCGAGWSVLVSGQNIGMRTEY